MATITLDGEGFGDYGIAGLLFHDGQTEVDVLTVKQAYLLHALGAKVDGEVRILTPPAFEDETAPEPEPAAPAHSTADDLAAIGDGGTWDSIGEQVEAEPELEDVQEAGLADDQYSVSPAVDVPVTDPVLDTPDVELAPALTVIETEGAAPTDVAPQPEAPQDAPAVDAPDVDDTPVIPEPETVTDESQGIDPLDPPTDPETPEALEDRIPPAEVPMDTDAPAPVISEDPDGSTATEAAVLPSDDTAGDVTLPDSAPADDTAGRHVADDSADTATA